MTIRLIINVIAICAMALFTGAMLNIGLTLGAYWKSLPPAVFLDWFATNSHLIARTIPFFVLPAAIGLIGSIYLGWSVPPSRALWLTALACLAGVMIITFAYHLPTNARFVAKSIALESVSATLDRWLWLHIARIGLGVISTVLGIVALTRQVAT